MTEVVWTKLFACELALPKVETSAAKKCRCGNARCKRAKKIRCVCQCHAVHHGEEQRRGMAPLDEALGLDTPQVYLTRPLGDAALDRELSGRAELDGEI